MRQERRRHPRLEIPLETQLRPAGEQYEISATMQDLSAGGAGLLTTVEIPVGTEIERLRFDLPDRAGGEARPIVVAARVARCETQEGLGGELEYQIGVQFLDIGRELFDLIQRFVFQHLRGQQKDRVSIERPIAIRFDRFDDFVDEVSVNLSTSGMFIRTRDPRPPGSVFNFQFQLGEDFSLIEGRAEVVWRRRHSEEPDKLAGMGVKFVNLDVPSQRLIERLIAQRQETGKPDAPQTVPPQSAAAAEPPPADADTTTPTPSPAPPARRPPPDLERAEAAVVRLGEMDELREVAAGLRQELEESRRAHARQLEELRARLEDHQAAAASELEERLRAAETARRDSERQRGELAGELETARREAAARREQVTAAAPAAELERIGHERDTLRASHEQLQADLERATRQIDEQRQQLEERAGEREIERLGAELTEARAALDEARAARDELSRQLEETPTTAEIQQLVDERDALRAGKQRLLGDLDRANREADELRLQIADRAAESELERLTAELADLRSSHDELRAAEESGRAARAELEGRLEEIRLEGERLRSAAAEDRESLQQEHAAALEHAAAEARDEASAAAARQADAQLEELRAELQAADERRTDLEAEAESLRREIEETQRASEGETERLRGELRQAGEARSAIEGELERAREEARRAGGGSEVPTTARAAAGASSAEAPVPRRGRRTLAAAALLLIGALVGILAVAFVGPLGSLAERLRPAPETTAVAELRTTAPPAQQPGSRSMPPSAADRTAAGPAGETPPAADDRPAAEPAAPEPSSPPEPSAPEPDLPATPQPDLAAAAEAVRDWAAAWSAQRVDDYLASYAASFQPPGGQSRRAWAATRRQRIEAPASIDVAVAAIQTQQLATDRVNVSFDQSYASDTYSDRVRKNLLLVWEDDAWRIADERVIE